MKFVAEFEKFLTDEVNLNRSRIDTLTERVENIESFLGGSDYAPRIRRFSSQGSWAHKTIIKPPADRGFDADLLVFIGHIPDWTAEDYVYDLRRVFRGSGIYKDKASLSNRCMTIEYTGDFDMTSSPASSTARAEPLNSRSATASKTSSSRPTRRPTPAGSRSGTDGSGPTSCARSLGS